MKKTLFAFVALCAMMLFACCSGEPKLEGEWVGDVKALLGEDTEEIQKAEMVLNIEADKLSMAIDMEGKVEEDKSSMDIGIKAVIEGTYTREGNELTLTTDPSKATIEIYKFDVELDEETKALLTAAGMTEEQLKESFKKEMHPADLVKEMPNGKVTIKEITATTLVLVDDTGKEMSFKRK